MEFLEEETHEGDDVRLLLQSFYGTRDASANFQEVIRHVLAREVKVNHGDDFIEEQEIFEMVKTGVGEQVRGQHGGGRRRPRRRSTGDKRF